MAGEHVRRVDDCVGGKRGRGIVSALKINRCAQRGAAMRGRRRGAQSGRTGAAMRRRRFATCEYGAIVGTYRSAGPRARVRALCPAGPFGYSQIGSCPAPPPGDQTKRGVSLNFPDQVTSERRFGAMPQSNCPYARCSTSELMTWQKKSRGLQSKLRKTENIALVRANRERPLGSLFAHSSTLGEVSFFLE